MFRFKVREQLEAIQNRHHHIGDHDMRSEAFDALDGLPAIARRRGNIAPACHYFAETLARGFFVVHNEHTLVGHIESLAQRSKTKRIEAGEVRGVLVQQFEHLPLVGARVRVNRRHIPIVR